MQKVLNNLTAAPAGSPASEAPNRNMKSQSSPDSQHTSPDWQYPGGVINLGIPSAIASAASFKKFDPATHEELSTPTGRSMRPVLHPGLVSSVNMDGQTASVILNRLEADGWSQFNYTVQAPDGARFFKVNASGLEHVKMKVVESVWLQGRNETLFGQNLTTLMKTVQNINYFDGKSKDANNFVFSDKPTRDYFFSPVQGAQSTLINVNIKDVLCGTALDQVAHAVLERHLAKMNILVPTSEQLKQLIGKNNLSGVDMADFLKERQRIIESAKTGDKDAYAALHQEEVRRLKTVQSIFEVIEAKDATMAVTCLKSEREAMDNTRPHQAAEPNFEQAATNRLRRRGIPEPK